MGMPKENARQKTGGREKKGNTLHLIHIALTQILIHILWRLLPTRIPSQILNQILFLQVLPVMEGSVGRGEGHQRETSVGIERKRGKCEVEREEFDGIKDLRANGIGFLCIKVTFMYPFLLFFASEVLFGPLS